MKPRPKTKKSCPVTAVASLLSDTWTMLIVHNLLGVKNMRFCALERTLDGISTRTLTIKLKTLEEKSIVKKTDDGYHLTKKGLGLKPIIKAMENFGKNI